MEISVNGQLRNLASGNTLAELLTEIGQVTQTGIAVAVNEAVIPKHQWPNFALTASDKVIIITATQGG